MTQYANGIPAEDGMFSAVEEADYHADRESISVSGAKILVQPGGPAKFRERMDNPPPPKPEYTFGHAAHALVLGKGATIIEVDAPDWRTKAAKEIRDQACNGVAPMLTHELNKARAMAAKVKDHPIAGPLFANGHAEVSLYTTDEQTGVRLRGRCDWITMADLGAGERPVIVDYKTAVSADPELWTRKAADYGYDMQFPWYVDLYGAIKGDEAGFLFVVQEKVAPYLVSVVELDMDAFMLGREKSRQAIDLYASCREFGEWPGYADQIHSMSLPPWAFRSSDALTMNDLDLTTN